MEFSYDTSASSNSGARRDAYSSFAALPFVAPRDFWHLRTSFSDHNLRFPPVEDGSGCAALPLLKDVRPLVVVYHGRFPAAYGFANRELMVLSFTVFINSLSFG